MPGIGIVDGNDASDVFSCCCCAIENYRLLLVKMSFLHAKVPKPDDDFFGFTLMTLSLDDRADIVELFSKYMKDHKTEHPDYEYVAWEWYGKDKTIQLSDQKREDVFRAMKWIFDHRYRIIHHKMMRDGELQINIYKWKEIDGKSVALYDDYDDWTYYTTEEKSLLFKECQVEADSKYRRKFCLK